MNKKIWLAIGFLWLAATVFADTMYIQVEKARLLEKPSAFAHSKKTLTYRTPVEVIELYGAFYKVTYQKKEGYLPQRSLSGKKPQYSAKLSKEYVSSEEVALATKGFNAQVEADYRKKNPDLNYKAVDRMEAETTYADPTNHFMDFRKEGKVGEYAKGGN
jgi:hypothetical protein